MGLTLAGATALAGGIQGAASLIGLPIQGYLQKKSEERQHQYNKEAMAIQQGYARENAQQAQFWTQQNMALANTYNQENAKLQQQLNEESAINAHNRNLQMYEQTQSTQAKIAEMEKAGLSIGLLNGTPSQGGASSGGTASTNVSGISAPSGQMAPTAPMGVTQAQTLNIMDTLNNVGGNIANIAKTLKETEIADAQAEILKIEASMKEQMTAEELKSMILTNGNLLEDMQGKRLDNDLKVRIFENQVKLVSQQVQLNTADLGLKEKQTILVEEQTNALISNVALAIKDFEWKKQNAIDEREFEEKLTKLCNEFKQQLQDDQQAWADTNREDEQEHEWMTSGFGIASNGLTELFKVLGSKKAAKYEKIIKHILVKK